MGLVLFVKLRVNCGKGTYIRSLAHDIGEKLGCGGYVKELRRTAIGEFKVEDAEKNLRFFQICYCFFWRHSFCYIFAIFCFF